jgi:signal transduction histidine kinase
LDEYGLKDYFEYFFSIYNPVFLALIFLLLLIVVIYTSYKHIYKPLLRKHRSEKENLELKNAKLLSLFVELDPNPIIKIDPAGIIMGMNNSAKSQFKIYSTENKKLENILGKYDINIKELIDNNESRVINIVIDKKFYEVNVHGISLLNMAQLYFYDESERKAHIEQMTVYQKLLKESTGRSTRELEKEKGRLSALLHDSVGQNLLLLKLSLQNLRRYINGKESQEEFAHTSELIDRTINEVKEISRSFRPPNLEELGLKTALVSLCKNVSRESHLDYTVNMPEEEIELESEYKACLYRVTQESLNNIIKHSKAKSFSVSLNMDEDSVTLLVSDDGIGFKPTVLFEDKYISDGIGLMNMQDLVESLDGSFHIDSSINNGTLIIASLPGIKKGNERKNKSTAGR